MKHFENSRMFDNVVAVEQEYVIQSVVFSCPQVAGKEFFFRFQAFPSDPYLEESIGKSVYPLGVSQFYESGIRKAFLIHF